MGKELYEHSAKAKALMDKADGILGFPLTETMFFGDEQTLRQTRVTQPAIFVLSVALSLGRPRPDMVAGHSLGEFSALTVAGVLSFEDALRLVRARAEAMQRCCDEVPGSMAAIIGLQDETIERICESIPGVIPANYNAPGQVVISGGKQAVALACKALKEAGAKRALPLPVSGAFHSPLMEPAREELAAAIEKTPFQRALCPVYQNATALPATDAETLRENLLRQLTSPVRWTQTIRGMKGDGAEDFVELGPGNVLTGLLARIQ